MASRPVTITLTNEIRSILPVAVRRKAGFRTGDQVEIKESGGIVHITPKLPRTDDEYTQEQRKTIDSRLDEAEADIKAGRMHGPFETHAEMIKFLHGRVKKARGQKSAKTR